MKLNYPFTEADSQRAYDAWGANCGPNALAVCLNMTLDAIRPCLGDFESKRYMSPTMMKVAIAAAGAYIPSDHRGENLVWPTFGLVRIQWHGPWMATGANPKWAYGRTHWIHVRESDLESWTFDVNGGWRTTQDWAKTIAPVLAKSVPRSNGEWSLTHSWEVSKAKKLEASQCNT